MASILQVSAPKATRGQVASILMLLGARVIKEASLFPEVAQKPIRICPFNPSIQLSLLMDGIMMDMLK